jgi:hypothetical protein
LFDPIMADLKPRRLRCRIRFTASRDSVVPTEGVKRLATMSPCRFSVTVCRVKQSLASLPEALRSKRDSGFIID